jgi:hypothetical protein
MPPKPFYEINPQAYLFGKTNEKPKEKANKQPEEKIRQWALFELLSTYGISINNIEIERPVKIGATNLRADIVILRESAPYVVIECKKWGKKDKGGMQQALSYADANTIKARYAVYTNGDIWHVKRKVGGEWVDVPDLPKRSDDDYIVRMEDLLISLDDLTPAFYWLNQAVPAESAQAYFACLQNVFNGTKFPLNYLDRNLRFGTDLLLRVIKHFDPNSDYVHEKLVGSCRTIYDFIEQRTGRKIYHNLSKDNLWQLTIDAQNEVNRLVEDTRDLVIKEVMQLRIIAALLQYLMRQIKGQNAKEKYFDVPAVLNREFQDLVGFLFQVHLGVSFPDPVLEESCSNLRSVCFPDWEQFKREENPSSK